MKRINLNIKYILAALLLLSSCSPSSEQKGKMVEKSQKIKISSTYRTEPESKKINWNLAIKNFNQGIKTPSIPADKISPQLCKLKILPIPTDALEQETKYIVEIIFSQPNKNALSKVKSVSITYKYLKNAGNAVITVNIPLEKTKDWSALKYNPLNKDSFLKIEKQQVVAKKEYFWDWKKPNLGFRIPISRIDQANEFEDALIFLHKDSWRDGSFSDLGFIGEFYWEHNFSYYGADYFFEKNNCTSKLLPYLGKTNSKDI